MERTLLKLLREKDLDGARDLILRCGGIAEVRSRIASMEIAFLPAEAIAKWNELVPSNQITDWDWANDSVKDAEKACKNPVFEARFEELCQKAEALARDGDQSKDFRWMIESYGAKPGNWWKFIHAKPPKPSQQQKKYDALAAARKRMLEESGVK